MPTRISSFAFRLSPLAIGPGPQWLPTYRMASGRNLYLLLGICHEARLRWPPKSLLDRYLLTMFLKRRRMGRKGV